jgi:hypothetical protein
MNAMNSSRDPRPCANHAAALAIVATFACALGASAQMVPVKMVPPGGVQPDVFEYDEPPADAMPMPMDGGFEPNAGGDAMPAPIPPELMVQLGPAEIATLKALYEALDPPSQDEMRAYYRDLGVDLDMALGLAQAKSMQVQRGQMIAMSMRDGSLDFTRKPEAVLNARARLGFGQVPYPNPETAQPQEVARWIHLHIMAGEWKTFANYLETRPLVESEQIFNAILQAMNRGDIGLLPEEVLAFTEASPVPFKPWQLTALGRMLQQSAQRNSTGEMLDALRKGTRYFGPQDDGSRRRTVDFLAAAGLLEAAYEFLPSLEDARAASDGGLLVVHARYMLDLAKKAGEGPEEEALRLQAFLVLAEASLLPKESTERRREALKLAIGQMNNVPKVQVQPWLAEVFASPALGPAALEQLALSAVSIGNMQISADRRAKAILNLKESVDVLLAREDVDSAALRVPLRMVTTALVAEMERAVQEQGRQQFIGRDSQFLYRAIPSERWLASLEPSVATRARAACIGIATIADETDQALALLDAAIAASPKEAARFADQFLSTWVMRLQPENPYANDDMMFFYFYRDAMPMAPLTRGRQRRNLDRLIGLIDTLREVGVDARTLPSVVTAFRACHAQTEVYARADIERVFGDVAKMPPATAAGLAMSMGASLNGDWRSREAQQATGTKRSDGEIAQLVDKGYEVAIALIESAVAQRPTAWNLAVINAALTYDRLQFRQSLKTPQDPVKQNELRKAAFEAFGDAAARYVAALTAGQTRDDPNVYRRWFGAAMGTAELNFLRPEDLPKEGTLQDDQIDLIRKSIDSLEAEARDRHLASFAADIEGAVQRAAPEVKPRLVRHALRIVGAHPAGASLRSMEELYRDLVKNEIKLRLTIDGGDEVGVGKPFGALLSLRFTNSVDKETGGFSKYLQNGVYARVGNSFRPMNYRDELQKAIRETFGAQFDVDAIGFFDAFMPPRGVVEDGQDGWLEKPLAYLVLTRKDPAVDTIPAVVMEMQFTDQTGPVTLALPSNTPLLATGDARAARACSDLEIQQLVDVRAVADGAGRGDAADTEAVTLEIRMRGKGVLPEVREALAGLDTALPGYTIAADGIVAEPPIMLTSGEVSQSPFAMMRAGNTEPKEGYPEPDATGMYRLPIERSFKVTYTRASGAAGREFTLPTLVAGVDAKLESRFYDDLDISPVIGAAVPVKLPFWTLPRIAVFALAAVAAVLAGVWLARSRKSQAVAVRTPWEPSRVTPLGVVTSLRRLERERGASLDRAKAESLRREISMLELKYFGPDAKETSEPELREVIDRWSASAR